MLQIIESNYGELTTAIIQKKMVSFTYESGDQTKKTVNAEPYLIGRNKMTQNIMLSAYYIPTIEQIDDKADWKFYLLNKMSDVIILDKRFIPTRPKYNPNPVNMDSVLYSIKL